MNKDIITSDFLERYTNKEFTTEQFVKGGIYEGTRDYGRSQFVDTIYDLTMERQKLKSVLDEIREYINKAILGYSNWEGTKPLYLKDDEIGKNLLQILDKVKG